MPHAFFFEPPIETQFLAWQFKEIWIDKAYSSFLDGKTDLTILDIGASGITPYYFSQFAKAVYAIEPSSEHFENLTKMVEYNKLENVHPINKAIYIKPGMFPLYLPYNKTSNSLHQGVLDSRLEPKSEEVEAITLPQLFAEQAIEHVDFMKLDVEGSEFEIICNTGFKEVSPKIDAIFLEAHAWAQRNPQQLIDGLKDAGFKDIKTIQADAHLLIATK